MHLNIGDNKIIKTKKIIGIFNLETLKNEKTNKNLLSSAEAKIKNPKTLIILEENKKEERHYISLPTSTLNKRLKNKFWI